MRSDFIGDCARFHGLSEAVTASQYLVPALMRDQRAIAIRSPVEFAGGEIEPALVQQVLNDTNEDPDQLPVLQHAMMRCWQQALAECKNEQDPPKLTRRHYAEVGGVSRALSIHANLVLEGLTKDSVRAARAGLPLDLIAKRIFQSLTDIDSHGRTTRRPQKFSDLVAILVSDTADAGARSAMQEAVRHVVVQFADPSCSFLRGIQESDLTDASVIDIGHEALIRRWDRLYGPGETNWVREEQVDGETFGDLLSLARTKSVVPKEELLRLEKWWTERRPTAFWAKRYVKTGTSGIHKAERVLARSRRARQYKVGIVALIVLLLAVATATYVIETKHARDAARAQAQSRGKAAVSAGQRGPAERGT